MSRIHVGVIACFAALLAGCAPLYLTRTHTTSTPRPQPPDMVDLAHEPVATLGLLAPASLQGFSPFLSHPLAVALADGAPQIRARPAQETINRLNEQGLAGAYAELVEGFARSSILDRDRLRRIGSALGSRYVFLPGVAELNHTLVDRFDALGLKMVRNQIVTLRLWLQLWDTQSGRMLWESAGEATVSSPILTTSQTPGLDGIAQNLWLRMIRDDLVSADPDRDRSSSSATSDSPGRRLE